MKGRDAVTDIGASAMMDIEKLSQWLTDSRIDPNDPANSELIYLLKVCNELDEAENKLSHTEFVYLDE